MMAPDFSVLIAWSNRDELGETLRKNHAWFANHSLEVVVVNCGGSASSLRRLVQGADLPYVRQIEIPGVTFNKSLALNIGVYKSRAPLLLTVDADIIFQSDFLQESLSHLEKNAFVTLRTFTESARPGVGKMGVQSAAQSKVTLKELSRIDELEIRWTDDTTTHTHISRADLMQGTKAGPGILIAKKEHFLGINGYNSEMRFWGWEDVDVLFRLQRVFGLDRCECGSAIHLTHDDSSRAVKGDTRAGTNLDNFLLAWSRYARGNFAGTYKEDVAKWADLVAEVGPPHLETAERCPAGARVAGR